MVSSALLKPLAFDYLASCLLEHVQTRISSLAICTSPFIGNYSSTLMHHAGQVQTSSSSLLMTPYLEQITYLSSQKQKFPSASTTITRLNIMHLVPSSRFNLFYRDETLVSTFIHITTKALVFSSIPYIFSSGKHTIYQCKR